MATARKKKAKKVAVSKSFSWKSTFSVCDKQTLNFTDIVNNNNKFYNIEIQFSDDKFVLYTEYGRVGGTKAQEYRECDDLSHAKELASDIIDEKQKKGYVLIKLASAEVVELTPTTPQTHSSLTPAVQKIVTRWFKAANDFIDQTLDKQKCPLGILSKEQLQKGYDYIESLRKIVDSSDESTIVDISNKYYANIPHNFGYSKIDFNALKLNSHAKLDKAIDFLDVLSSAKDNEQGFKASSDLDKKYHTLNSEVEFIDLQDPIFKWIEKMVIETRAANHGSLGNLAVRGVYKLKRSKEEDNFLVNLEKIAKECGKSTYSKVSERLLKERPDLPTHLKELYEKANVWAAWHGTRRANIVGIMRQGFLIRPAGVIHAGSAFGDAIYFASQATKSLNYTDVRGSYWARGNNKSSWMFLCDAALGKQKVVNSTGYYTADNIRPNHSVWAPGGGAVINDEMMVYHATGKNQQHAIRYVVEVETQV